MEKVKDQLNTCIYCIFPTSDLNFLNIKCTELHNLIQNSDRIHLSMIDFIEENFRIQSSVKAFIIFNRFILSEVH